MTHPRSRPRANLPGATCCLALALLLASGGAAFSGDDALFQTPTEVLAPTVIEVGEGVPLFLTDRGWTDDELRTFVFDGPDATVPLDGSALFLATALVSLVAIGIWRRQL